MKHTEWMDRNEFNRLAMRTAKKGSVEFDMQHAMLGIVSETLELMLAETSEEIAEEAGDVYWFYALLADAIDRSLAKREGWFQRLLVWSGIKKEIEFNKRGTGSRNEKAFITNLEIMASAAKSWHAYGRKTVPVVAAAFLLDFAKRRAEKTDIDPLAACIEKLKKRYPNKYSDALATERLDKK